MLLLSLCGQFRVGVTHAIKHYIILHRFCYFIAPVTIIFMKLHQNWLQHKETRFFRRSGTTFFGTARLKTTLICLRKEIGNWHFLHLFSLHSFFQETNLTRRPPNLRKAPTPWSKWAVQRLSLQPRQRSRLYSTWKWRRRRPRDPSKNDREDCNSKRNKIWPMQSHWAKPKLPAWKGRNNKKKKMKWIFYGDNFHRTRTRSASHQLGLTFWNYSAFLSYLSASLKRNEPISPLFILCLTSLGHSVFWILFGDDTSSNIAQYMYVHYSISKNCYHIVVVEEL